MSELFDSPHPKSTTLKTDIDLPLESLLALYGSVGWTNYTKDPALLQKALQNSSFVVSAWSNDELLGLARCLSDDASIFYLQDILVKPTHQNKGLGRQLLGECLQRYSHVRQKVLLTDNDIRQNHFYKAMGFQNIRDLKKTHLNAFVQYLGLTLE